MSDRLDSFDRPQPQITRTRVGQKECHCVTLHFYNRKIILIMQLPKELEIIF